jgi:hypothetical protein
VIQVFAPQRADQPFHEWMGQGDVGDGLDFCRIQYPQIGFPLVEPIERIIVGAEVVRCSAASAFRLQRDDRVDGGARWFYLTQVYLQHELESNDYDRFCQTTMYI